MRHECKERSGPVTGSSTVFATISLTSTKWSPQDRETGIEVRRGEQTDRKAYQRELMRKKRAAKAKSV